MEEYKGYQIVPADNVIGYEIKYIGRGSNHLSLRGIFTDKRTAKKFIDVYLEGKEVESGETSTSGRSKQIQRRSYNRRKPSNNS